MPTTEQLTASVPFGALAPRLLPKTPSPCELAIPRQRAPRVLHAITPSRMAGAETFLARLLRRSSPERVVNHCVSSPSLANDEMLAVNMPFDRIRIGGKGNLLAAPRLQAAVHRFSAD